MGHETNQRGIDNVDPSPEAINAEMEETRSALTGKLEALEERVTSTVEAARAKVESYKDSVTSAVRSVKRTFDLPYQVRQRPWPMFGASVAAGFVLGG